MSTQVAKKTVKKVKPQKDKQGSAIVSMILGIISILFFVLAIIIEVATYGLISGLAFAVIGGIVSIVGFPLGISARKTSKGRGMAIAGITLTVVPFLLVIIALIMTIVMAIFMMDINSEINSLLEL